MGLLDSILGQVSGQSVNSTTSGSGGGAAALMPALMAIMAACWEAPEDRLRPVAA